MAGVGIGPPQVNRNEGKPPRTDTLHQGYMEIPPTILFAHEKAALDTMANPKLATKTWYMKVPQKDLKNVPQPIRTAFARLSKMEPPGKCALYEFKGEQGEKLYTVATWNGNGYAETYLAKDDGVHLLARTRFHVVIQQKPHASKVPGLIMESTSSDDWTTSNPPPGLPGGGSPRD